MLIKKILFFMFIAFSIVVIQDLANSIYNLWQKSDLIGRSKQELRMEREKHKSLKQRLEEVKRPRFVEEEARNKLSLVKEGEEIVVAVPTAYVEASPSPRFSEGNSKPNWQLWREVFF